MTDKFEQFINDTYKSLVSELAPTALSSAQSKVVHDVGTRQKEKGFIAAALGSQAEKKALKAVDRRKKVNKAKLPGMVKKFEAETTSMEVA